MHTHASHVYSFMVMISMLTYNYGLIPYLFIRSAVAVTKLSDEYAFDKRNKLIIDNYVYSP